MKTIHVHSRSAIMRRAWEIARCRREEIAREAREASARVVGVRIVYAKSLEAFISETPLDLGAAQRQAWAETRRPDVAPSRELDITRRSELAPLRRLRSFRVWRFIAAAAGFFDRKFISSRAA